MPVTISNQINLSSASATIKNGTKNSVMIFNDLMVMQTNKNILYNQVSLIHAQIPVSYYTVNDTNNLFVLSTGSYTLTNGNYNATSFKTMFLSLLGTGWTMTLDTATGKYTLTKTSGKFLILTTTTCYKLLGLAKNTAYSTTVNGASLTFPFPCNFLGMNRIKIKTSVFKTDNLDSNSGGHSDLLATIPVDEAQYGLITYENLIGFKNTITNTDIHYIDITITDEDDEIIDFNGIDIYLTLQVDSIITDFEKNSDLVDLLNKNMQKNI